MAMNDRTLKYLEEWLNVPSYSVAALLPVSFDSTTLP